MTPTEIAANAVEVGFATAGDFVKGVTWRKVTPGDYNVAAGARTVSTRETEVRAIEDKITQAEYQRVGVSQKAVKLLIPAVDFTTEGIEPVFDDQFVHESTTYKAKSCQYEGTKALWEIFGDV